MPSAPEQPPTEDLYLRDKKRSKCKYYYYRLLNPYVRLALILPIIYLYTVSASVLTYRGNSFQARLDPLLKDPKSSVPGSYPLIGNDERGWFILYDLGFVAIPSATPESYSKWGSLVDFSSIFFNVVFFVVLLVRRDCVRLFEYVWCQMVLFAANGVVHVVTSLPDSGGIQPGCYDPKYYSSGKHSWYWGTLLFSYCGDMMWSGHTMNTLLPMIMIRRLIWDTFGWHFTFHDVHENTQAKNRKKRAERAFLQRNQQLRDLQILLQFSTIDVHFDSSPAYTQFVFMAHERAHQNFDEKVYSKSKLKKRGCCGLGKPENPESSEVVNSVAVSAHDQAPAAIELEEKARLNHSVELNEAKHVANSYFEDAKLNQDNDIFFHVKRSPYVTPLWAARHRKLWWCILFFIRCLAPLWFAVFVAAVFIMRLHYTADVVVAVFAVSGVAFNPSFMQGGIRFLYRPYYHNYLNQHWWSSYYPSYPLNVEQVNLEERIRRTGYGGFF